MSMDPRNDLLMVAARRADFERRASQHRLVRSLRHRRTWPTVTLRRRPATAVAPLACCPA